jgi:hypothetical protein
MNSQTVEIIINTKVALIVDWKMKQSFKSIQLKFFTKDVKTKITVHRGR